MGTTVGSTQSSPSAPTVSIIVPTTCESRRADSLRAAIDSVLEQHGVGIDAVIVVNGNRYDPQLLKELKANSRLRVLYQAAGSLPRALKLGRNAIKGEFFGFLDDDDELLPGALDRRLQMMQIDSTTDVVVSNGSVRRIGPQGAIEHSYFRNYSAMIQDPMLSLLSHNWLASCGGLFRAASISEDFFDDRIEYNEWTVIAFKVCARAKLAFLAEPTFRVHETAGSLSRERTERSAQASVQAIDEMINISTRRDVTRQLRRKLGASWHSLAEFYRTVNQIDNAWKCHLRSLRLPGATRYLAYTREFVKWRARAFDVI